MTLTERVNELKYSFFNDMKVCMTAEDVQHIVNCDFDCDYSQMVDSKLDELLDYSEDWYREFFNWFREGWKKSGKDFVLQ